MTGIRLPKKLKTIRIEPDPQNERFHKNHETNQKAYFNLIDPSNSSIWGFVSIDNTKRGPALGGVRMVHDLNLNEISRLAHVMTLKNSCARIPYGGAKAGLIIKSDSIVNISDKRKTLMGIFADALLNIPLYKPSPDMGTNEQDIQVIHDYHSLVLKKKLNLQGGAGRPESKGGVPINEWQLTACSLFSAIKALEDLDASLNLSNAKFVVQGFGNVGASFAIKLQKLGGKLVGASDINIGLYNSNGLDANELDRIKSNRGGLINYKYKVEKKFSQEKLNWLLEAPCDILIPAARPDAINARNADRIQCRFILQGADSPSSKPVEYYLYNHKNILSLTDFIVNAGGAIGCAVENKMNMDDKYKKIVQKNGIRTYVEKLITETVTKNTQEIYFRLIENRQSIFRDHASKLGLEEINSKECWL